MDGEIFLFLKWWSSFSKLQCAILSIFVSWCHCDSDEFAIVAIQSRKRQNVSIVGLLFMHDLSLNNTSYCELSKFMVLTI